MAIKIPAVAVASAPPGHDDVGPAMLELLRSLSLLPTETDAKENGAIAAFKGAPDSVAVIEAGATAASKWWATAIAGGATVVVARITAIWDGLGKNAWNQPFALLALGLVFAAAAAGIAYLLGSDVRGRAAASVATIEARQTIAAAMLEEAGKAYRPSDSAQVKPGEAPIYHVLPQYAVENSTKSGTAAEQGWKALLMRQKGDAVDFYLVKGAEGEWVAAGKVVF